MSDVRTATDPRMAAMLVARLLGGAAWGVAAQLDPRLLTALGAPWLLVGFAAGAIGGRRSWRLGAGAGTGVLVAGVLAYYWALVATTGRGAGLYAGAMAVGWSAIAVPAGAAFGLAGAAWRRGAPRVRAVAGALVPAALAAEAAVLAGEWEHRPGASALLAAEAAAAVLALAAMRGSGRSGPGG